MDLKKSLLLGSALLAGAIAFSACSDDSSSSPSGTETPNGESSDSNGGNGNNGDKPGGSSTIVTTQMGCSEIMFHGLDSLEWIEFHIASGEALKSMAASDLRLSGAVELEFPDEPLGVDEYVVATNDMAMFKANYPNFKGGKLYQWKDGDRLSNSGDVVSVKLRGNGDVDCSFDDDPPWPSLADGKGYSLVFVGGKDGNASLAQNWAASKTKGGNPGSAEDPVFEAPKVRINEVNPTDGAEDWIEFYNAGDKDADISGWQIVAKKRGMTIAIPSGSVVPAGGYLVLDKSAFTNIVASTEEGREFILMSRGESLYLREMAGGTWTNSETGLEYPAVKNATAGIIELSDGTWAQGALAKPSKGKANEGTLLSGPLYISEIYYNPPEDDGSLEFMEIYNRSDVAVPLYKSVLGGFDTWDFNGIGTVNSASTIIVPARGILLLLPDTSTLDTAEYRKANAKFWGDKVVIGLYTGKISNRGEKLVLKEPYQYISNTADPTAEEHYYSWSDAVLYSDGGMWPKEADGAGKSLHRVNFDLPGSDPAAWAAADPNAGRLDDKQK